MTQPLLQYATPTSDFSVRRLLIRWEKLRLLYNAILIAEVLLGAVLDRHLFTQNAFWSECIVTGCLANVCYCIGPYADLWFHQWWPNQMLSTQLLFFLGLFCSVAITAIGVFMVGFSFGPGI